MLATKVLFNYKCGVFGGAIVVTWKSIVIFQGNLNSIVTFINNAGEHGGALCSYQNSMIVFDTESSVAFSRNCGYFGAALFLRNSFILFNEACIITVTNNAAEYGGVFYNHNSTTSFTGNSSTLCTSKRAVRDGVLCTLPINLLYYSIIILMWHFPQTQLVIIVVAFTSTLIAI